MATGLLAGSADAANKGAAAPKWSGLGNDMVNFLDDLGSNDSPLLADGNKVADACGRIPDVAKRAGGMSK